MAVQADKELVARQEVIELFRLALPENLFERFTFHHQPMIEFNCVISIPTLVEANSWTYIRSHLDMDRLYQLAYELQHRRAMEWLRLRQMASRL